MASSSNPKRIKTIGHKKDKGKKKKSSIYSHHFLSKKNEDHFQVIQNRRLLMERQVEKLYLDAPDFGDELERRNWACILTYPEPASIAIVKEFYANARHFSDEEEPFLIYVRGRRVPFDALTINSFLGTDWPQDLASCEYTAARSDEFKDVDIEEVERVLCVLGGHFHRNHNGKPLHIKHSLLTPVNQYWVALIHANISPCSHVFDLITTRAILLYFILQGRQISLGQLIATENFDFAQSANPKAPLGYPSLITYLCALAGVDTSEAPFERPRQKIDGAYYRQHCMSNAAGIPAPGPQQHHEPVQTPQPAHQDPQDAFSMLEMRQMLQHLSAQGTSAGVGAQAMDEEGTEEVDSDGGTEIIEDNVDEDDD
ncbi:uncharacterized protein LOC106766095 [Vigna radiata var. radiata]|uniref:Uncharacterized protein LOC106766095 n=1 Tax=Vigna radiata var. radiata TaxID=3916 RepID=A0A1S3UK70_VIGRR|nr:uncharacterized protein LOC106766095 [Vigna radiata var. radiata]